MNDVPCLSPQLLLMLKDELVLSKIGHTCSWLVIGVYFTFCIILMKLSHNKHVCDCFIGQSSPCQKTIICAKNSIFLKRSKAKLRSVPLPVILFSINLVLEEGSA